MEAAVDKNIELLQREAKGRRLAVGRWWIVGEVLMYSDVAQGWSQVRCVYCLILVSLYVAHLKFLGDTLVNGGASCKDVSGHGERKLALHEIVFQL